MPTVKHPSTIKLLWRARTARGWRYLPCVYEVVHGMSQPRHGYALLDGQETHLPVGTYYLRSYIHGKKIHTRCKSQHPRDAAYERQKAQQAAQNAPIAFYGPQTGVRAKSPTATLQSAFNAYVRDLRRQSHNEAAIQAAVVQREFLPLCDAPIVRLITREHVLAYHDHLRSKKHRNKKLTERTIANKHVRLRAFLRWTGTPVTFMPKTPKFDTTEPEIYKPAQLMAILKAASTDPQLEVMIEMALQLGIRMQELKFACWDDLDVHHGVYTVRSKPDLGFIVKDREQREIPVPKGLLARLVAYREQHPDTRLILGTAADKPNNHLLRALKRLAVRAGLNPKAFTLQQFRRTFLTLSLRGGFDARTVQAFAGHSELSTTLRYLKPMSAKEIRDKATGIWG
jgi:integrase